MEIKFTEKNSESVLACNCDIISFVKTCSKSDKVILVDNSG